MIEIETGATDTDKPCVLIENLFANGSISASSTASGTDIVNVAEENTFDFWTSGDGVPDTIDLTLSTANAADCLAIVGHNLGTNGNSVFLSYWDGAAFQTVASLAPSNDDTLFFIFPEQSSDQWRVFVNNGDAPTISYMMLGKRIVFPTGVVGNYTPSEWSQEADILGGETNSGQFLGQRVLRRSAEVSVNVGRLPLTWYQTNGGLFQDHFTSGRPFIYAGWPAGLPNDVALCWRGERNQAIRPSITEGSLVSLRWTARAYVAS